MSIIIQCFLGIIRSFQHEKATCKIWQHSLQELATNASRISSHKVSEPSGSVGLTDSPFQAIRQLHQMQHLWPETQMRPNQKPSLLWWLQHLKCDCCRNPRLRICWLLRQVANPPNLGAKTQQMIDRTWEASLSKMGNIPLKSKKKHITSLHPTCIVSLQEALQEASGIFSW